MFAALFIFALATAHAAELPSYIRVCGRKDANYDQCIMENTNNMKDKICTGMPEFNVPPNEPIVIDNIVIYDTDNLKLNVRDSKIIGICDAVINSIHTDPERLHFDFDVTLSHLVMNTSYDFEIRVLVPLANKGLAFIIAASFIHVCGRNDPNCNQCIADNILNFKEKFCYGSSKYATIEPLKFDIIDVFDENNFKLSIRNAEVYGTCDFVITSVHVDPDRVQFNFNYLLNRIVINGMYDVNLRLMLVPVAHKGIMFFTTDNVELKVRLDLKVITKNGKKHIYASKGSTSFKVTDFEYKFREEKELGQLHKIFSTVMDDNKQIIISRVAPVFEQKVSKLYIETFNNVTQSNYEKFFPENV